MPRVLAIPPLLLPLLASPPAAAVRPVVDRVALCRGAALVVTGEVTGLETRWSASRPGELETRADVSVDRALVGALPPQGLVVRWPGGTLDGLTQWVDDTPALAEDARYLLILSGPAEDGAWIVRGGPDGALRLRDAAAESAALASLAGCLHG